MRITNEDNMVLMSQYPDNYFELAIIDPPYGLGINKMNFTQSQKGGVAKRNDYSKITDWDKHIPSQSFFNELFRVSKNQIIWGGNYFPLPLVKGWIVWDKKTDEKYSNDFADCELAWTSFDKPAKIFRFLWSGMLQNNMKNKEKRIHPTQKPVQLYRWLLQNYAKKGDKILDTHLGSGSIMIACDMEGFDLTACELDTDYYNAAMKRFEQYKKQLVMNF